MEQRENKEDGVCPSKDGVCPPESTEKEDGVCPSESTLRHQHEDQSKVQRKPEPESSPTAESEAESGYSSLSFRRNRSKDFITDFKSGQPSAVRSPAGSDSPLSEHGYPSCGSSRSTDTDLDFNNQGPTPPESYRRTNEELLQHQQEVIRHQEAQLRHQEAQLRQQEAQLRQQEIQRHQEALLHQQEAQRQQEVIRQQEAQRQQEVIRQQEALLRQQEAQRHQEIQLQAERKAKQETEWQLKLKRLEDQQHLNSGKNNSHKSQRKPPEFTPYLSYINILDRIYSTAVPLPIQERSDFDSSSMVESFGSICGRRKRSGVSCSQ